MQQFATLGHRLLSPSKVDNTSSRVLMYTGLRAWPGLLQLLLDEPSPTQQTLRKALVVHISKGP